MNGHDLIAEMTAAPDSARFGVRQAGRITVDPAEYEEDIVTFDSYHRVVQTEDGGLFQITVVEIAELSEESQKFSGLRVALPSQDIQDG